MRWFALAVVSPPELFPIPLTPRARTQRDRERALRDALLLSCLIGLLISQVIVRVFSPALDPDDAGPVFVPPPNWDPFPEEKHEEHGGHVPEPPPPPDGGEYLPSDLDTSSVPADTATLRPTFMSDRSGDILEPGPIGNVGGTSIDPGNLEPDTGFTTPYDEPPMEVSQVMPEYPEIARQAGLEGTVHLHVRVGTDGRVVEVRVLGRASIFDESATSAVRRWRFRPALVGGRPVAVWISIPVRYTLR